MDRLNVTKKKKEELEPIHLTTSSEFIFLRGDFDKILEKLIHKHRFMLSLDVKKIKTTKIKTNEE